MGRGPLCGEFDYDYYPELGNVENADDCILFIKGL